MLNSKQLNTRTFGSILLIAGSCIGAGMLAIPTVTAEAGFWPAFVMFFLAWAFMTTSALLLLEVNLWMGPQVSIISMAARTLGRVGKALSWLLFCYLFYLLLTAYTAGSGVLVGNFIDYYGGRPPPNWVSSLFVTCALGLLVFIGTQVVDWVNRYLMVGLVVAYIALVGFGLPEIREQLLDRVTWAKASFAMPVLVISFGFHNMIPSLNRYLEGDARHMRRVVVIGSLIPLAIYLIWELVVLGVVPTPFFLSSTGKEATEIASNALGAYLGKGWLTLTADYFAFFAIITSVLGQALSLVDFLADGIKKDSNSFKWRGLLSLIALIPPYLAGVYNPKIFITALSLAGAYGAVVLFGIMPALMVWRVRYVERQTTFHAIGGGRPVLILVVLFALLVMALQVYRQI